MGAIKTVGAVIRTLAALAFLLIVVAIVVAAVGIDKKQSDDKKAVAKGGTSGATPSYVSSDDLQGIYSANELRGDELYKDKVLEVTGAIQSIDRGIGDEPYVVLWTRNEFAGVQAHFQDKAGLSSLAKGQHITVRCMGDGMIMGSPMLRDCVLVAVQ
jgi:hypothetical protein